MNDCVFTSLVNKFLVVMYIDAKFSLTTSRLKINDSVQIQLLFEHVKKVNCLDVDIRLRVVNSLNCAINSEI